MIKKALWIMSLTLLAAPPLWAGTIEDIKNQASEALIAPFAKDLGGLVGATDFHSASVPKLGGFDIGLVVSSQSALSDELVAVGISALAIPMVRAEAGLPFGVSVFVRGTGVQGATLIGGGARYQLYDSGLILAIPDVAVTVGLDKLSHDVLDMSHLGVSVQASFNIPVIKPFIGLGYDRTTVELKQATKIPEQLLPLEATASGTRLTVGANLTLIPFTYLYGAYSLLHDETGIEIGLGIRFGGIL